MSDPQKRDASLGGVKFDSVGGPEAIGKTAFYESDFTIHDGVIANTSTSTDAQIKKLVALLRQGPKTTHSLRMHGISHPAGRISDLRKAGCVINTEKVKSIDSDGFTHCKTARYSMLVEVDNGK